jgi:hypothetical protein
VREAPKSLVPPPARHALSRVVPVRLARWWDARFGAVTPYERWGYRVWAAVGVVIAVPEIWAAGWGDGPWPTISGTTGHLEDLWKPTAIVVVALIVVAAARTLGYGTRNRPSDDASVPSAEAWNGWWAYAYFFGAVLCIALPSLLVAGYVPEGKESRFVLGYVMYGLIGLFFLVIPLGFGWALAHFFGVKVPFPTLFGTVAQLEKRVPVVALVVLAGLVILLIHLALYPWPDISHHHPDPGSL